jgi:hypothetical protein
MQSPSPATDELQRALVDFYAAIMIYLSKAKSYFGQNTTSQFEFSDGRALANRINRAYLEERTAHDT